MKKYKALMDSSFIIFQFFGRLLTLIWLFLFIFIPMNLLIKTKSFIGSSSPYISILLAFCLSVLFIIIFLLYLFRIEKNLFKVFWNFYFIVTSRSFKKILFPGKLKLRKRLLDFYREWGKIFYFNMYLLIYYTRKLDISSFFIFILSITILGISLHDLIYNSPSFEYPKYIIFFLGLVYSTYFGFQLKKVFARMKYNITIIGKAKKRILRTFLSLIWLILTCLVLYEYHSLYLISLGLLVGFYMRKITDKKRNISYIYKRDAFIALNPIPDLKKIFFRIKIKKVDQNKIVEIINDVNKLLQAGEPKKALKKLRNERITSINNSIDIKSVYRFYLCVCFFCLNKKRLITYYYNKWKNEKKNIRQFYFENPRIVSIYAKTLFETANYEESFNLLSEYVEYLKKENMEKRRRTAYFLDNLSVINEKRGRIKTAISDIESAMEICGGDCSFQYFTLASFLLYKFMRKKGKKYIEKALYLVYEGKYIYDSNFPKKEQKQISNLKQQKNNISQPKIEDFYIQNTNLYMTTIASYTFYAACITGIFDESEKYKAIIKLQECLKVDPDNSKVHLYLANIYYDLYFSVKEKKKRNIDNIHSSFMHFNVVISLEHYNKSADYLYARDKLFKIYKNLESERYFLINNTIRDDKLIDFFREKEEFSPFYI